MVVSKGYCASNGFSTIGYDVWIAHDAVVMAGANVATGAAVEWNAVVTKHAGPSRLWSEIWQVWFKRDFKQRKLQLCYPTVGWNCLCWSLTNCALMKFLFSGAIAVRENASGLSICSWCKKKPHIVAFTKLIFRHGCWYSAAIVLGCLRLNNNLRILTWNSEL
jgi:hypothetical protein